MGGGAVMEAAQEVRDKVEKIAAALGTEPSTAEAADLAWFHPHRLPATIGPRALGLGLLHAGQHQARADEHGGPNFDETFGSSTSWSRSTWPRDRSRCSTQMVSDCGTVINPMTVEGQLQGACPGARHRTAGG